MHAGKRNYVLKVVASILATTLGVGVLATWAFPRDSESAAPRW